MLSRSRCPVLTGQHSITNTFCLYSSHCLCRSLSLLPAHSLLSGCLCFCNALTLCMHMHMCVCVFDMAMYVNVHMYVCCRMHFRLSFVPVVHLCAVAHQQTHYYYTIAVRVSVCCCRPYGYTYTCTTCVQMRVCVCYVQHNCVDACTNAKHMYVICMHKYSTYLCTYIYTYIHITYRM